MPIDTAAVDALLLRARKEVEAGLLPSAQVALAKDGELIAFETFGDATNDTRYCVFSSTKAFVAGAIWALIGDGLIDVSKRVVDYIPEFGTNGKDVITIEQVMLHTSGFPSAPMPPSVGNTSTGRLERFAKWRLNWEPGTAFEYHPTSAHWVLAELIERVSGADYRDFVETRITKPAGLPRLLGIAVGDQAGVADMELVGEPATKEELLAAFGVEKLPETEVTPAAVLALNEPSNRAVGVPGGGGLMRACDLALYYQALLHDDGTIWDPAVRTDATTNVRSSIPDIYTGVPANRSLGLVLAGSDGKAHLRGFGRGVSAGTFGHNGAYGQLAWADPVSGLSLGYCTNGLDLHEARVPRRGTAISSLAAVCAS